MDDEKEIRDSLTTILQKKGAEITSVGNLHDAKKLVLTQYYDVVISDVMLPHLGGFEISDIVKEVSKKTPIILITGMEKDVLNSTMNKADLIVTKPFSGNDIIDAIEKVGVRF